MRKSKEKINRTQHYKTTEIENVKMLDEIFQVNDREIFLRELQEMEESITANNLEEQKEIILTNFIFSKVEEINTQIFLALQIKNKKDSLEETLHELKSKINVDNMLKDRDFILNKAHERLSVLGSAVDNCIKVKSNSTMIIGSDNNIDNQVTSSKINSNNNLNNILSNVNNNAQSFNVQNNMNNIMLKFKVYYFDGSEIQPQIVKFQVRENINFDDFMNIFKKNLGIYEFAKFKILILLNKKEIKFLADCKELKIDQFNEIKIVPEDYNPNFD